MLLDGALSLPINHRYLSLGEIDLNRIDLTVRRKARYYAIAQFVIGIAPILRSDEAILSFAEVQIFGPGCR